MWHVKPSAQTTWRRLLAELIGTALLVTVVVGSGIAAASLSPSDVGLQLLENSTATAFGLAVLILVFGPVSGGHFNPVISAVDWLLTRRSGNGLPAVGIAGYATAQLLGFALARTGRAALSAAAVGAYIGAAYWFTSSTSFANPAVTVGRIFSDTFAGVAPTSALFFIAAQVLGGLVGLGLVRFFFPDVPATAGQAVVPHLNHVPEEG